VAGGDDEIRRGGEVQSVPEFFSVHVGITPLEGEGDPALCGDAATMLPANRKRLRIKQDKITVRIRYLTFAGDMLSS
jgi:hypothetical protein